MSLRIDPEFESFIPALSGEERKGLEQSILQEGVRDPLVVWGGVILDGHNRYRIATGENEDGEVLEFETVYKDFPGREAAKEWIAENQLNRRNLSKEWTSYLRGKAYKTAKKSHGGDRRSTSQNATLESGDTAEDVAEKNGVQRATIYRDAEYADAVDRLVEEFGHEFRSKLLEGQSKLTKADTLQLAKTVDEQPEVSRLTGELLLNEAAADLKLAYLQARTLFECGQQTWDALFANDEEARVRHNASQLTHLLKLAQTNEDEVTADLVELAESGNAKSVFDAHDTRQRERAHAERQAKREEHRAELKEAPMPDRKYEIVYADPPWRYEHDVTDSRSIENQYPTMSLEEIKALDVPADQQAMLFLWCPVSLVWQGLEVVSAWGFDYRTSMIWDKEKMGMGYYVRQQCEMLLIGRKNEYPTPAKGTQPRSLFRKPPEKHSAKPHEFYELIEAMYPSETKVELFARSAREGWDAWGFEAVNAA